MLNWTKLPPFLLAWILLFPIGSVGAAGPSRAMIEQARRLRLDGEHLLKSNRASAAIRLFAESYVLFQSPGVLMLLGRALLENGQFRQAGELCQRFLREQPSAPEAYVASMCRTMAVEKNSGDSLLDISELSTTAIRDLNLADAHMLLGNYELAEKFADHFLAEVHGSPTAGRYVSGIIRTARGFLGKRDPFARGSRPVWRKTLGSSLLVAGVALVAWGTSVLALEGRCVGSYDSDPLSNPSCRRIYANNLGYGIAVVVSSGVTLSAAIPLLVAPGPRPERELALHSAQVPDSFLTLCF